VRICKVIGTVVSTVKDPGMQGLKLLVLEDCDLRGAGKSTYHVAVDAVGAGLGEIVLSAAGSSARQTSLTGDRPVDAVIMGIVDLIETNGEVTYRKTDG